MSNKPQIFSGVEMWSTLLFTNGQLKPNPSFRSFSFCFSFGVLLQFGIHILVISQRNKDRSKTVNVNNSLFRRWCKEVRSCAISPLISIFRHIKFVADRKTVLHFESAKMSMIRLAFSCTSESSHCKIVRFLHWLVHQNNLKKFVERFCSCKFKPNVSQLVIVFAGTIGFQAQLPDSFNQRGDFCVNVDMILSVYPKNPCCRVMFHHFVINMSKTNYFRNDSRLFPNTKHKH